MPSQTIKNSFAGLLALLILTSVAISQTTQYTKNGADQTLRSTGRVNPSSLGLEIDIALGSYPGRGINVPLGLSYSSKVWRFEENASILLNNGSSNVYVNGRYSESAAAGWTSSFTQPYIEYTDEINRFDGNGNVRPEVLSPGSYDPGGDLYVKRVTIYLPGGKSHELRADDAPISVTNGTIPDSAWNGTYYSVDGSGIKYVQDNTTTPATYKLLLPDGSTFDFATTREDKNSSTPWVDVRRATRMTDVNGNYLTFNAPATGYPNGSVSDQLGRTFPILVPRETPTLQSSENVLEQSFTLPGMNSNNPYVFRWKRLKGDTEANSGITDFDTPLHYIGHTTIAESGGYTPSLFYSGYSMGCSSNHLRVIAGGLFNPVVLTEVVLPNGALYKFTYNKYGEIEQIHYPTGGREELQHASVASLAQLEKPYQISNRGVTSREVYESDGDATPDTWTYLAASSDNRFRTSVIAPDGTQTDRFMHRGVPGPPCVQQDPDQAKQNIYGKRWGYDNVLAGMAYEERVFSSAGQIVERTLTRWSATNTSTVMTSVPLRYAQRNARTLTTETIVYDGDAGLSTATALEYDTDQGDAGSPLNVLKSIEYAYKGVSGGSSLSRATATTTLDDSVPALSDPTQGSTPVKMTEITYLQNDPNYDSVESNYLAKNLIKLPTKTFVKNGAGTVTAAKSEIRYDETNYGNGYRGQPTTVRNWLDTNDSWIETKAKYDTYGNAIEVTDGRNNTTTTTYDSTYHAFPVQVTSPVPSDGTYGSNSAFVSSTSYNATTGVPTSTTDPNNQTTQISYNDPVTGALDPMLRVRKVTEPNGRQTITEYGAGTSAATRFIKTKSQIDEATWKESYVWYDGLGRTIKSQTVDSNGDAFVETQYDNMSRPYKVSNPYRSGETVYWTESVFDTAGRPWKTVTPDNAFVETTYSITGLSGGNLGTAVTVKDQAGKLRRSITNALGHLTRIDEPTTNGLGSIDAPNQPTFYTYDLLNNLTQVQQPGDNNEECGPSTPTCSQTRSFQYDSLSRLRQATNPESGTIEYTYDANGNLQTKTDARGIVTTYAYDALNRVKTRTYTDEPAGSETPDVAYYYDLVTNARGKLIKVTNGTGDNRSTTEYVSFDILGRVTRSIQTTDNVTYGGGTDPTQWMTYTYTLSGALIEQQYPSGRVVKNVLDGDGELAEVKSKKNPNHAFWNFADNFSYSAAGAVTSMQLGNGRWESTTFNNRLQPKTIALGRGAPSVDAQGQLAYSADLLKLEYQYGDLDWDGSVIAGTNNGNVAKQTITVQAVGTTPGFTAVQNYDYDSLNRIQIASETLTPTSGSPEQWTQEFKYDRYGNRTFREDTTTTLPKNCGTAPNFTVCTADVPRVNPSVSPSDNRLNGYAFDTAGNTTHDAENRKLTYDAENRQTKVETVSGQTVTGTVGEYVYDGDRKRVKKRAYENNVLTEETIFLYDATGKLIGEYANQVATSQDAKVAYLTSDHLGSPRINTDINGNVTSRHDYHPFGEEVASSKRVGGIGYAEDRVRKRFTGYERDGETGLDFAKTRYHTTSTGRFSSPDLYVIQFELKAAASDEEKFQMLNEYLADPRNLNRYAYALNNPLKHTDPTGMRPPNAWEQKALDKLDELIKEANQAGRKDLAEALTNAKNEMSSIIAKLAPKASSRAVGIAVWAILNIGNKDYSNSASISADGRVYGPGSKCNVFVAVAHRMGGNIPAGSYPLTDGVYPVANYLGDIKDRKQLKNLPVVFDDARMGDVVAWRAFGGESSGHSAIAIGGGAVVYAGGGRDGTPKVETMAEINDAMQTQDGYIFNREHDPGVIRRYNGKP